MYTLTCLPLKKPNIRNFAIYQGTDLDMVKISDQITVRSFFVVDADSIITICNPKGEIGFALVLEVERKDCTSETICLGQLDISMYSFPNPKTWKIVKPKSAKYPCDILRELRRNANLTQKELAQDLGVPQSHISQYELGQRNIPRNKAKLLGGIFGCSAKDFLNEI